MKKKIIILCIVIVSIIIGIISYIYKPTPLDSMSNLPNGDYLNESTSPNGMYTIRTYLCNGGATVDYAVRGELIINTKNKKAKNVYWEYRVKASEITWDSDDTVIINDHEIDLPNGKYDWRVDK